MARQGGRYQVKDGATKLIERTKEAWEKDESKPTKSNSTKEKKG